MSEWGNLAGVMPSRPSAESIGRWKPTQGSEPSQYLEEEKATAIPSVAASERGTAQTSHVQAGRRCVRGVVGLDVIRLPSDRGVTKRPPSRTAWNGRPQRVIAPYTKGATSPHSGPQVPRDTWNPVGIREDHLPRLNTSQRPIANQYREGKVKSTPVRGVKST